MRITCSTASPQYNVAHPGHGHVDGRLEARRRRADHQTLQHGRRSLFDGNRIAARCARPIDPGSARGTALTPRQPSPVFCLFPSPAPPWPELACCCGRLTIATGVILMPGCGAPPFGWLTARRLYRRPPVEKRGRRRNRPACTSSSARTNRRPVGISRLLAGAQESLFVASCRCLNSSCCHSEGQWRGSPVPDSRFGRVRSGIRLGRSPQLRGLSLQLQSSRRQETTPRP